MNFVKIDETNLSLLDDFISNLGSSSLTFRYFNSRSVSVIKNHIVTLLLVNEDGKSVGYGHLDRENDVVWLGTAIVESHVGMGLGSLVIKRLCEIAVRNNVKELKVSIDKSNYTSINMCKKQLFEISNENENTIFMKRIF